MKKYAFLLSLLFCTLICQADVMLTGNWGEDYKKLPNVPRCKSNVYISAAYYYTANVWPNIKKDVRNQRNERIPLGHGILTDGSTDTKNSAVVCDNNLHGSNKPETTYFVFDLKQNHEVTALVVVPAYPEQDHAYNLMKCSYMLAGPNGKFPDNKWKSLGNFYSILSPHGQRPKVLVKKFDKPIKTSKIIFNMVGYRKLGIAEVYILGKANLSKASDTTAPKAKDNKNLDKVIISQPPVIIIPNQASKLDKFAADLIKKYAKEITGNELKIINDEKQINDKAIFIGNCPQNTKYFNVIKNSRPETFYVRSAKDGVHILGTNGRGVVYGAIGFLEAQGCRWITPGPYGSVIPKLDALELNGIDKKQSPRFMQRFYGGAVGGDRNAMNWWGMMNRLNGPYENQVCPGLGRKAYYWAHSYHKIVPPSLFEKHPEYFALSADGRRMKHGYNFCTTNLETIQRGISIAKNAKCDYITISPDDGTSPDEYCHCNQCRQLDSGNKSRTDRAVTYANHIAKALKDANQDKKVMVLAYSAHRLAGKVQPLDNVIIQYCDVPEDLASRLNNPLAAKNIKAYYQLRDWAKIAKHLEVYCYYQNGAHTVGPMPILDGLEKTLIDYEHLGVDGFYTQSQSVKNHYPIFYYVMARMLWNGETWQKILKDICPKFYGPGGNYMFEYYNILEDHVAKKNIRVTPVRWDFPNDFLSDGILEKLWNCLNNAYSRTVTEKQRLRIDQVRLELLCTELYLNGQNGPKQLLKITDDEYILNPGSKATSPEKLALFDKLTNKLGIVNLANYDGRKLAKDTAKLYWRSEGEKRFKIVHLSNGIVKADIVPGLGGRILRFIGPNGHNYFHQPDNTDNWNHNFGFGGYEEYMGSSFRSNGWSEPYKYMIDKNHRSITMETTLKAKGIKVIRKIWLTKDKPSMNVKTTITKISEEPSSHMIRPHPQLWVDRDSQAQLLEEKDGILKEIGKNGEYKECWHVGEKMPRGLWAVRDAKGKTLINRFNTDQVEKCYVFWGGRPPSPFKHITMELFGKKKKLKKGDTITLEHSYQIMPE